MGKNNKALIVGSVIVVIIAAIVAVSLLGSGSQGGAASTTVSSSNQYGRTNAPIMITDPAQVPAETSALVFGYSAMQVNVTNSTGTAWVNATGSGTVNLIAIQNSGQVMGYANIGINSNINQVRFIVNWVNITVNGTTYPVPVSKPQLTLSITGNSNVNSTSGVLIDYTPTVSPAFNQNATAFVRVPAGKAVIAGGVNSTFSTNIGATATLWAGAKVSLAAVTPNITITSASLTANGNSTVFSVTVKNNANQSVVLNNIVLYGRQNVSAESAASAGVNASVAERVNAVFGGVEGNVTSALNLSVSALLPIAINIRTYAMQNFAIGSNGTLTLVTSLASAQTSGVTISPGANATLLYNGTATYNSGTFQTTPTAGSQYRIVASGKNGVSATGTVTAG